MWKEIDTVLYYIPKEFQFFQTTAIFSFIETIVHNCTAGKIKKSPDNIIKFMFPNVKEKLEEIYSKNVSIILYQSATDKTAEKYKAQIQHYLMIYGADKMYLSMFFGNMKWGLAEVLPDKTFQNQLESAEILFWHLVQTKTPPPDFVDFNNFNEDIKEHNNGREIIPLLTRQSES